MSDNERRQRNNNTDNHPSATGERGATQGLECAATVPGSPQEKADYFTGMERNKIMVFSQK